MLCPSPIAGLSGVLDVAGGLGLRGVLVTGGVLVWDGVALVVAELGVADGEKVVRTATGVPLEQPADTQHIAAANAVTAIVVRRTFEPPGVPVLVGSAT
jgi:hypothetical protein